MSVLSTESSPLTGADALQDIRATLSDLVSSSGLNLNTSSEACLHSLSPKPLPTAHRTLNQALRTLRVCAQARESWNSHSTPRDRLRRVKSDIVSRRRVLQLSKQALAKCRRLAATKDPFASPVALTIQKIQAIADANGAATDETVDTDGTRNVRVLTVCGKKFIADFTFIIDGAKQNTEDVQVSVKFRILASDESEMGDPAIDASYVECIKKNDFDTINLAFKKLIAQEKLSESVKEVPLIDALHAFEEDLMAAQALERDTGMNEEASMKVGHGVINRSALGLCIRFMEEREAVLGFEEAAANKKIAISRSNPCLPPELQVPGTLTFEFDGCKMAAVGAQYALSFKKPVFVCLNVAQRLERVGITSDLIAKQVKSFRDRRFPLRPEEREEEERKPHYWPSLQSLLAPNVFGKGPIDNQKSDVVEVKEIVKKREHWSQPFTEFITAVELPEQHYIQFSHSGSDMIPGLAVHRVPLCHPQNVKPIFALIRQQVTFNTLFESCFSKPVYVGTEFVPLLRQPIEVVISEAPSFLQLNMFEPSLNDILGMAVSVQPGGNINVALKTMTSDCHVCSDQEATNLLTASRNVPLTVLNIVRMGMAGISRRQ